MRTRFLIRLLLISVGIAAIVVCICAQEIPTNAPPAATTKSGNTISKLNSQQKTEEDEEQDTKKPQMLPCQQDSPCFVIAKPENKSKEEQTKEESFNRLYRGYMWATIIGVIGAWGGLIILICQTVLLRRSANAALSNAQAVLNSERAWIEITLGPPEEDPHDENKSVLFECSIQIKNHGRTVAGIEEVRIGEGCSSKPIELNALRYRIIDIETLLGSGQKDTVGSFSTDYAFSDCWRDIQKETKIGILQIIVEYRNVVESSTLHKTSVVYAFEGSLEDPPKRLPEFNVFT